MGGISLLAAARRPDCRTARRKRELQPGLAVHQHATVVANHAAAQVKALDRRGGVAGRHELHLEAGAVLKGGHPAHHQMAVLRSAPL